MRRVAALLLSAGLLAACGGGGAVPVSAASTGPGSTASTSSSTSEAATTAAPATTTTVLTHVWADRLVGTEVWAEWEAGGEVPLLRGDGVGDDILWMHLEMCLRPSDSCSWWLLFAARPTDPPLALEAGYDGFIALAWVEPYSDTGRREVVAAVDVVLPAGAGTAALLASRAQGPFWAVELGLTVDGLVVRRAWSPDLDGRALVLVDPAAEDLPDISGWAEAGPVVGRVVTARAFAAAPEDANRTLDLSGAAPAVLPGFREVGGRMLAGGALGWQETVPNEAARVVWLKQLLGWTYTGSALWRVGDSVEFASVPGAIPGYSCRHEASDADAVALVTETGCYACPVASAEAFRVDRTTWRFQPVPPGEVLCTCECEG